MANLTARKIFKQMYPATYNFKDDAVKDYTSTPTDLGFVDSASLYNGTLAVVSSWQSHRKVLRLQDDATPGEDPYIRHIETQATSGTREFYVGTNNITKYWEFMLYETGNGSIVRLRITDSALDYLDSGDVWQEIQAVSNDTLYHFKVVWRVDNTFDLYVAGILKVDNQATNKNQVAGPTYFQLRGWGDSTDYVYLDAYGDPDNDANYNIGDNIFWKNLKDSMAQANFEGEDVGTTSDLITFVDSDSSGGNASVEIATEFNEHKKVLKLTADAGGDNADILNAFSSSQPSGTIELYVKTSDATHESQFGIRSGGTGGPLPMIRAEKFQYYDGAHHDITDALDDTIYHIKIDFECGAGLYKGLLADTFFIWIDNIRYGPYPFWNVLESVDRFRLISPTDAAYSSYYDAIGYSWESDYAIADNRTFDYHTHSYDDITANISLCKVTDVAYQPSTAIINSDATLSIDINHIIQLYDVNSDLRFEGDFIREVKPSNLSEYPLISINDEELLKENSYSASAAEDINATLLGVLTNVDQTDGRLIYYTEDDPAGNLTPNYKNKPIRRIIKDLAIHGAKYGIIQPNGIVCLDADRNPINGAETISESTGEIMGNVLTDIIDFQYRYITIRGGIDPSTGTPFSGEDEDTTISGIKRFYKRFRELQSGTDCTARAAAFRTAGFTPTIVNVSLKSVYGLPGEIINFAYSPKSLSATNFYVEQVTHNLINGISRYRLNSGILDRASMNEPGYTLADETSDDIGETLYNTDINTILLELYESIGTGASRHYFGVKLPENASVFTYFYIGDKVDITRDITITFNIKSVALGTIDGLLDITKYPSDGTTGGTVVENNLNFDTVFSVGNTWREHTYTLSTSDIDADTIYQIIYYNKEATDVYITQIQAQYYIKRSV